MVIDIVERISQLPELANLPGGSLAADCLEAAVEIKQLRAENEKLRAALNGILADTKRTTRPPQMNVRLISVGALDAAKAALGESND